MKNYLWLENFHLVKIFKIKINKSIPLIEIKKLFKIKIISQDLIHSLGIALKDIRNPYKFPKK